MISIQHTSCTFDLLENANEHCGGCFKLGILVLGLSPGQVVMKSVVAYRPNC